MKNQDSMAMEMDCFLERHDRAAQPTATMETMDRQVGQGSSRKWIAVG
jgi:hypothetical protein